jgi:hypothetical protein
MADRSQLYNDPEQALRLAFDGRLSMLWTNFPGIVTAVDLEKNTCSVQPAIQGVIEDEQGAQLFVDLPLLVDVPICWPKAGGFVLTLPLKVGDEVLVLIASRCIDAWWQSGGVQKPMEARMHDLSDGFAFPGPSSQPNAIANVSATGAQLRNEAGTTFIEIAADGKIKIESPSEINLKATAVKVDGNLEVDGNLVATGEVTAGLIPVNLTTHVHPGVTSGPSNTGAGVG